MKLRKNTAMAVPLQRLVSLLLVCVVLNACASKKVRDMNLNGKILKDAAGNYYLVKQNVGDTMFLEKLDMTRYEKF